MAAQRHKEHLSKYFQSHRDTQTGNSIRNADENPLPSRQGSASSDKDGTKRSPIHPRTAGTMHGVDGTRSKVGTKPSAARKPLQPGTTRAQLLRLQKAQEGALGSAGINKLPGELLLLVFTYLSAPDLVVCARVCSYWKVLADDDHLWLTQFIRLTSNTPNTPQRLGAAPKHTQSWKKKCIKSEARRKKAATQLKKINPYTGLPANTEAALKQLSTQWRLMCIHGDNKEYWITHRDVFYFQMSVCIRWYGLDLPPLNQMKKLLIYSTNPVFQDSNGRPASHSICQRAKHYEIEFNWRRICDKSPILVSDDSVDVRIVPPLLIATWKDGGELAFITGSFHTHGLVLKSLGNITRPLKNSSGSKGSVGSTMGLYGCSCTMELRNQRQSLWSEQFRSIYFDKAEKAAGSAVLTLISPDEPSRHSPIPKQLTLPWKTDLFKNILQNLCILDFTFISDTPERTPVWTVSCPVPVKSPDRTTTVTYDYDGDYTFLDYADSVGSLHMEMVWEEELQQCMITCLKLTVSVRAVGE